MAHPAHESLGKKLPWTEYCESVLYSERLTCLVLDGDDEEISLLGQALDQGRGAAELVRTHTLAEACAALDGLPEVDVTVTRLELTDSHGLETLERLLEAAGPVPVVVLAGVGERPLGRRALALGAQDVIDVTELSGTWPHHALRHAVARAARERAGSLGHRLVALLDAAASWEDAARPAARLIRAYAKCDGVGLRLLEPAGDARAHVGDGALEEHYADCGFDLWSGQCWCSEVAGNGPGGGRVLVADSADDQRVRLCLSRGFAGVAVVPLGVGDQVIGVIHLVHRTRAVFSRGVLSGLEQVAAPLALAIARMGERCALAASEARQRALLEAMAEGVVVYDAEGVVHYANPAMTAVFGGDPMVGRTLENAVGARVAECLMALDVSVSVRTTVEALGTRHLQLRATSLVSGGFLPGASRQEEALRQAVVTDLTRHVLSDARLAHLGAVRTAMSELYAHVSATTRSPQALLDATCACLAQTRGWLGVWLVLTRAGADGAGPSVERFAAAGLADPRSVSASRALPRCLQVVAGVGASTATVHSDGEGCAGCSQQTMAAPHAAVVVRVADGAHEHGVLTVLVPQDAMVPVEELRLLEGVARGLGHALTQMALRHDKQVAQEALAMAEARARRVLHVAPVAILTVDQVARITTVNPAGCALFQRSEEDLTGVSLLTLLGDGATQWSSLASGDLARLSTTVATASGSRNTVWRCVKEIGTGGEDVGFLLTAQDVTELMRAEAQLAISDRMASVGRLAAGIAHEINNPLTYILYNLKEVREAVPQMQEAFARARVAARAEGGELAVRRALQALGSAQFGVLPELLRDAESGVQRIAGIVRDLSVFARVDRVAMGPVDLGSCVRSAMTVAHHEIRYRATLVDHIANTSPVMGEAGRLSQLVLNVLMNAAQAISPGDVAHQSITVRVFDEDGGVVLEVADTGEGIPMQHQARIFDPFYTTKPVGVGSGLGLSICQGIARDHLGELTFTSEPGVGSTFRLWLPRPAPTRSPAPARHRALEAKVLAERVLVVDDDERMRGLLRRVLQRIVDVVVVASGAEALALLADDDGFDLVLCDVMMPEVSGVEVYRRLAGSPVRERFAFMTGGAFTVEAVELLEHVDVPCLHKPFDAKGLRSFVAAQLART